MSRPPLLPPLPLCSYIRNPVNDQASLDLMEEHGVGYSRRA